MAEHFPLVTLGMPVYNEAKYIVETLENLLRLTYPNLEILISDNASEDGTSEICAEYAKKYEHIKHIRHPKNLGQHANFNYLPRSASGEYFCWASAHDLLDPSFVNDCVKVLESDPGVVLAYPRTMNMTKDGEYTREKARPFDITHMQPAARFREVMWRVDCNYVYGMFRRQAMLDSNMFQAIPASDRVFLAEMAIKGIFAPVDTFKYYRMSRERVQSEMEKRHRLMAYLKPHRTFTDRELAGPRFYLPTQRAYRRVIEDANLPPFTRWYTCFSIWLSGAMKMQMYPGGEAISGFIRKAMPTSLYNALLRKMQ